MDIPWFWNVFWSLPSVWLKSLQPKTTQQLTKFHPTNQLRLELKRKLSDFKFGLDGNVIQWNCTARSSNMPVDVVLP